MSGHGRDLLASLGVPVQRLVIDSREIRPGDTFVALPGEKGDGRQHIDQAIARGANAVIWESRHFDWNPAWQIANLPVADLRHQAGDLADAAYGAPSARLWVVGVTGTNGKTSTSHWIAAALSEAGRRCALIGTLGNGFAGDLQASANTTPDAIRVHGLLADFAAAGAEAVAMEVSSHALVQGRVAGVRFDVALLTNLSRDHLDYHGDMESYAAAKRQLFDWPGLRYAVLNLDQAQGVEWAQQLREREVEVIAYGLSDAALKQAERHGWRMVHGRLRDMSAQGLSLRVHSSWGAGELHSGLVGRFNAENLLGGLAVLLASGMSLDDALHSLSRVEPVVGRMQRVSQPEQPAVIVDYAHTPDALEKVLVALREACVATGGRLICVFGCGGDRDRGKRAMMGRVAERFADQCIVTSDNPRFEAPEQIIAEIVDGMYLNNKEIIVDRAAAISHAIAQAGHSDTVLLAGKGHEDYQEMGGVKQHFSDTEQALRALADWTARQGVMA